MVRVPKPILASKGYWLYLVARGPVRVPQPILANKGYWLYPVVRILPWGSLRDLGGLGGLKVLGILWVLGRSGGAWAALGVLWGASSPLSKFDENES